MSKIDQKAIKILNAIVKQAGFSAMHNTDVQTYEVFDLYDIWNDIPNGTNLDEGSIVSYEGILYRVNKGQGHAKQDTMNPKDAVSLFTPIPQMGQTGSIDNPIEWISGMESEKGKYYIDGGVKYLCIESSGTGLWGSPKDLPRYFKQAEDNAINN